MAPRIAILMLVRVDLALKTEKLLGHFSMRYGSILFFFVGRFVHINIYDTSSIKSLKEVFKSNLFEGGF